MTYNLIVVGGGVSGVTASIFYKRKNPQAMVLIIESKDELLKKLNATGAGKGNFTNEYLSSTIYDNSSLASIILKDNPKNEILSFFDTLNIKYTSDSEGRYYPFSYDAKTISQALITELKKLNIDIILNKKIESIKYDSLFIIDNYKSRNLLISVGGINYPSLGSDGSLYDTIKTSLGHSFTKLVPSNIYIDVFEKNITKKLSGRRIISTLNLYNNDELIHTESGEVLFKDDALSGIVSFNISNYLARLYKNNIDKNPYIKVDFTNKTNVLDKISSKDDLYGVFSKILVDTLYNENLSLEENILAFKGYKFTIKGLSDLYNAQATTGGIKSSQLSDNLESKYISGLYFAGDILDISAPSGGYNLSIAYISGKRVGEAIK